MAGTLSGYAAILKEAYEDSNGVTDQINNETEILSWFKKSTLEWQGKKLIVPAHVARNTGVGNIAAGGALPTAGQQTDVDFIITNKAVAGRGQVERQLMKAAPSKGAGAFLSWMEGEVERLKDDIVDLCDRQAVSGGPTKGFLNERKISTATAGAFVAGGAANDGADVVWEYFGDMTPFLNVVKANTNTWVRIRLFRSDTLAEIGFSGGALNAIFVKDFDTEACTLTIANVSGGAGVTFTTLVGTLGAIAFSVELSPTQMTDGGGNNFGTIVDFALEPQGIFGNLCSASHFTVDRTTATGFTVLQSTILPNNTAVAAQARVVISIKRMQAVKDRIALKSKADPDQQFMHPLQRQSYVGILTATTQYQAKGGAEKADGSPTEVTFAGKALKTARHVPRGGILFLTSKYFELCEYAKGSFIDEDGNMLSRVPGFDSMEFAWTWYYNTFTRRPNAHGILCGLIIE